MADKSGGEMAIRRTPTVLVACGCFNPPTNMHFRLFERARDHLNLKNFNVTQGIISPVSDAYQLKTAKQLVSALHRVNMLSLATNTSDWIRIDTTECSKAEWSRTVTVLRHFRSALTTEFESNLPTGMAIGYDNLTGINSAEQPNWPVRVMLLCGADLLQSFAVKGLWEPEDMEEIVRDFGLAVVSREGFNAEQFVYESDLLTRHQANIHFITEWIANDISSTKIRRALNRGESVRYLVPDPVVDYIKLHRLYGTNFPPTGKGGKSPLLRPTVPQLKPAIKSSFRQFATEALQKSRQSAEQQSCNIAELRMEKVPTAKSTAPPHTQLPIVCESKMEKANLTQVYAEVPPKLYPTPKKIISTPIVSQLDSITNYPRPGELQKSLQQHLLADLKSVLNCIDRPTGKELIIPNCHSVVSRGFSEPPAVHIANSRTFASHLRPNRIAAERPLSYHGAEGEGGQAEGQTYAWEQLGHPDSNVPVIYPATFVRSQSLTSLKRNSDGWQISDAPETTV